MSNGFLGLKNKNTGFYTDKSFCFTFSVIIFFLNCVGNLVLSGHGRNVERERDSPVSIWRSIDVWEMVGIDWK